MSELLFEIGCEELPAGYAMDALKALPEIVARELSSRGLDVLPKDVRVAGTPRRLAAGVASLPAATPKRKKTYTGPPKSAAFDKEGKPTKAAEGFAQKYGLPVEKLTIEKTEKGEYLAAEVEEGGRATSDILAEALPVVIASIPFPKAMRWGALDVKFARAVRWILASLDGRKVPFTWGNLQSGTTTQGHRFLAPAAVDAGGSWDKYERALEKAHVIVDPAKRRERLKAGAEAAAKAIGGLLEQDDVLMDTVNFLVEEPHPILGGFDQSLIELPREVLVTPMKHHQRYFPVVDANGKLKAHFVTIANVPPRDPKVVARGNERVLRARLADARYFFDLDLKTPLPKMAEGLSKVVFQAKLGSYAEKVVRVSALAGEIRGRLAGISGVPSKETIDRAAQLSRADLLSKMVFEFPELQGLMGREYALRAGESKEVAGAIAEAYMPRGSGDALPGSHAGAVLSLADRLDTLAGIFGIGEKPTGSTDPYGLRRHALAVVAIVRARDYALPLGVLLRTAVGGFVGGAVTLADSAAKDALEFIRLRLENALRDEGLPYDAVDAALSARFEEINEAVARAKAVAELKKLPDLEPVAVGFKRAANILAKAPKEDLGAKVDPAALSVLAEKALHAAAGSVGESVRAHAKAGRWAEALKETVKLRAPIDAFYEAVMVMDKDDKVRRNRLAILREVVGIFEGIADFTRLAGPS